ncbi:XAC2610-related protein [Maribacter sp. Asnod1-A12]|uniref:XAC2610-related protein n=1 Tax=Maribacter sp. Asnod1-A12 TaxID=3160576 RepID=UPI003868C2AC
MNKILILLLSLISFSILSQTTYEINGFSKKYKGELTIENGFEDDVFKKGEISIYDINKNIITIKSEEFTFELTSDGNIETDIVELPYGKQSIIIYQDFNFDGKKDLAVMDGQFSCYHGPSFQVYLETGEGLKHSPEFTRLAQEYCGMFQIDYESETINAMTKSGCCWHQFSEFKVEENKPIPVKIIERSFSPDGLTEDYVEKNRKDDTLVETKYSYLAEEIDIIEVYSMNFENGKKMSVFRAFAFEDYLFYVFTDIDSKIELLFKDEFIYNKIENTLTFINKNVDYKVDSGGILVKTSKREVYLKAKDIGENVTLSSLSELKLKNLSTK